jgi:lipopolysaccharide export system protein LptC
MNAQPTASVLDQTGPHGFTATGRSDNAGIFQRAMRNSRHVRLLRMAVPAGLAVLLGAYAVSTWLDPMRLIARLPTAGGGVVISGTKITMEAPKLTGYTRDSRWYEFTAQAAAQDITKPDIVELQGIRAKLEMPDKDVMDLRAKEGLFNRKAGLLTLSRDILLVSSSGYEVRLIDAVIDTGSGDIVSDKPVQVKMLDGSVLNAKRLEVTNSGDIMRFEGGVTMMIAPESVPAASEASR